MTKVPVRRTVRFAYGFLVHHIATILGLTWIAALLTGAIGYGLHAYTLSFSGDVLGQDFGAPVVEIALSVVATAAVIFVSCVVAVGVTRQVLGLHSGPVHAYFPVGHNEWRMFAANLRYLLAAVAMFGLAGGISALAFMLAGVPLASPDQMQALPTMASALAACIAIFVFAYAIMTIVRIGVLLPAVVVAEGAGLRRAYALSQDNFWRLFAVMLAVVVPIIVLLTCAQFAILYGAFGPELLRSASDAAFQQKASEAMEQEFLPLQAFNAIIFILASGLFYSASAYGYRALVPEAPAAETPSIPRR